LRSATGAFLVLLILSAIALFPVLGGDRVLFPRDARSVAPWKFNADENLRNALRQEPRNDILTDKNVFDFPKLHLAYRLWKEEKKVPLWNPYTFCGNPLLASAMPSPLYPGNFFFLLDPYRGFTYAAFLHILLSGFFLFLFLRLLGFRSTAGLLAGTTYAFSGWYLVHLYLPSYLYAATWFPLMLYALEKLVRGRGVIWAGLLALAVALSALAGFPPVTLLSLYMTALYLLFRVPGIWKQDGLKPALGRPLLAGMAVILGLGLVAFQLLPTHDLSKHSGRSNMELCDLEEGALRPLGLLGLAMPDFFGNPRTRGQEEEGKDHRSGPLLPRKLGLDGPPPPQDWGNNYLENTLYIGVLPLFLALIALVRRPRPITYFWLCIAAVSIMMSLAVHPFTALLDIVPGLRTGCVKRFLFVFTAAGAILAGIGFDGAIGTGKPRHRWGIFPYLPAILLAVMAGPLLLVPSLLESLLTQLAKLSPLSAYSLPPEEMARWCGNTRWCILRVAAILVPASAIYYLLRRGMRPRPLRFAVLLLTFVDLAWLGFLFNPVHRPDQMHPTPGIEFLSENTRMPPWRMARYGPSAHFVLPPDTGMVDGIPDIQGWDVLFPARYQRFMNLIEAGAGKAHHLVRHFLDVDSLQSPLINLLGVRYVLTDRDWGLNPTPRLIPAYPLGKDGAFDGDRIASEGLVIYENTECLPRAFVAEKVLTVPDEDEAFKRLASPEFDPGETVILEERDPPLQATGGKTGVRIVAYQSRHVVLEVDAGEKAPLVLTDAYNPGWTAHLEDGTALPVFRADGVFRCVMLPERDRAMKVHFHYPGRAFQNGMVVAALSAAVLFLLFLISAFRTIASRRPGRA